MNDPWIQPILLKDAVTWKSLTIRECNRGKHLYWSLKSDSKPPLKTSFAPNTKCTCLVEPIGIDQFSNRRAAIQLLKMFVFNVQLGVIYFFTFWHFDYCVESAQSPQFFIPIKPCKTSTRPGNWCEWGPWSECSEVDCVRTRKRQCACPRPPEWNSNNECDTSRPQDDYLHDGVSTISGQFRTFLIIWKYHRFANRSIFHLYLCRYYIHEISYHKKVLVLQFQ